MEEQTIPARRQCGAAAAYYLTVEAHPEFRDRQRELEAASAQRMSLGSVVLVLSITLLTMPGFLHPLLILKDRVLGIVFIFSSLSSSMIAFNAALPLALHL